MIPHFTKNHGAHFLTFISLTILIVAFFQAWNAGPVGSVTVLLRTVDGVRVVEALELRSATFTLRSDIDPSTITTLSARTFALSDGTTISIDTPGIVRKGGTSVSVLVASPVVPLMRTPLAVFGDGAQLAWVSPADSSIQVFTRTSRGAYIPSFIYRDLYPNSLGFSEDGASLVVAKITDNATAFYLIALASGSVTHLTTIDGLASVVPTP